MSSLVRFAFVVAAAAGGIGAAAYALAWLLIPVGDTGPTRGADHERPGAAVEVALGTGLLLIAVLLAFRGLGVWFSDVVVWPLVLIASGGALIWRQSMGERAPRPAPSAREGGRAGRGPPCGRRRLADRDQDRAGGGGGRRLPVGRGRAQRHSRHVVLAVTPSSW